MISKLHLFAAALAGILICSVAGAQVHGGAVSARAPSMHARAGGRPFARSGVPARRITAPLPASGIQISPSGQMTSGFASFTSPLGLGGDYGVPGLGFDYSHLAAVSGALHDGSSFRFGHHDHFDQNNSGAMWYGGYPFYGYPYSYGDLGYDQSDQQAADQPQQQPQPQIIVIQQPAPSQSAPESGSDRGNDPASMSASQMPAPVRDVGDFILVRRDGRILFASAFSIIGTQMQYISPEGIRHSLAMADLDTDASEQMNEARGTTVQIHH